MVNPEAPPAGRDKHDLPFATPETTSISEQELLMSACPEDAAWIKANYLNANAAKCSPCRLFSALNVAWRCQVAERVLRSATPPSSRRLSI